MHTVFIYVLQYHTAQEPCLDMAIIHFLVPAILALVGQSTACVEWMIVSPPIIFGKTVQLLCSPVAPNINSSNTTIVLSFQI